MKLILQDGRRYILRFDKGEEVLAGLSHFMGEQNIKACSFSGIGSSSYVELGFFNAYLKNYRQKPFQENFEIISFSGTGGKLSQDGTTTIHSHGSFARNDFSTLSGHVFNMTVSATCEIFLIKLEGDLLREYNSDFNLNLLV